MKKRFLISFFATTMICSLFTACGNTASTDSTEQSSSTLVEEEEYETKEIIVLKSKKSVSDDGTSTHEYTYDEYGNLIKEISDNEQYESYVETTYEYDEFNRLIKLIHGDTIVEYEYDEHGTVIKERSNNLDKRTAVEKIYHPIYDENNNIIENKTDNKYFKCEYNEEGQLVKTNNRGKKELEYQYEQSENIIRIHTKEYSLDEDGSRYLNSRWIDEFDENNNHISRSYVNENGEFIRGWTREYDNFGNEIPSDKSYVLDEAGNIIQVSYDEFDMFYEYETITIKVRDEIENNINSIVLDMVYWKYDY